MVATVTFANFAASDSGYRGLITFNDQTNEYDGTDVAVGDIIIQNSNAAIFRLDTVYTTTLAKDSVFLTEITSKGVAPIGRGQIERRTANYGLSLFSPDNQNGISSQLLSIIQTSNIIKIDSLLFVSDSVANIFDYVVFDTSSTHNVDVGEVTWNGEEGTLDLGLLNGSVLQIGQEQPVLVKNKTGSTIPDGTPLRFVGTEGNSGRILVAPAIADGSYSSYYNFGAATQEILNDSTGYASPFGKVRGVELDDDNTSLNCNAEVWGDSTILYLDALTPGCYTKVKPTGANQKIAFAAIISAGNNGTMFVRPTLFAAIEDISGVEITNPANGQVIGYDNGVWVNTANSGWLKDSLNSADVSIDANGNNLELNNLDSLVVQGNAVFKNAGQFPLLNIDAANRLVEIPSQSTFRLSSNSVLTPIGASTSFIVGDAENDLEPITPDAAQNLIGINGGVYSSTVDASGNATVAHGLSSAPVSAVVTGITDDERTYKVTSIDATNINVVVYEGATKQTSTAVEFYWMVIK